MAKYKYGQFVKTPKGRFRVRKAVRIYTVCLECEVKNMCIPACTADLFRFCTKELPVDAYLEIPKIRGGKSTTSK